MVTKRRRRRMRAEDVKPGMWSSSEDTTDLEHGACIAIALALML